MPYTAEHALRSRSDFPALQKTRGTVDLAYLDGPGGSQVPRAVVEAIADVYATCNVNTHGNFPPSQEIDRRMQAARETVAAFLGAASADCISFGQNMTTLNYSLSHAIGRTLKGASAAASAAAGAAAGGDADEVLITELDHEANRGPWLALRERGIRVQEVRLLENGLLDYEDMAAKITPRTRLFALGASSNALGTVNDIALARRLTREVGAMLLIDAVHYAPHFPLDVTAMDVDFLLCSAYKFYGPHVGVLYSKPGTLERLPTDRLKVQDPAPPYRIETGTLNHAAIHGVRAAIDYLAGWGTGSTLRERTVDAMTGISEYEHRLAREYYDGVRRIRGVRVWGTDFGTRARAPTVSITLDRHTAAEAATALGSQGLCVWDGNFYAARAVEVLGLAERGGLLRTGISMYTSESDIRRLLTGIEQLS